MKTVVTTDSSHYQSIAQSEGASCNWLRTKDLAHDEVSSADMVLDVLAREQAGLNGYTDFILLQPTSPLRTNIDIDLAIALYEEKNTGSLVSVSPAECPMNLYVELSDDLKIVCPNKIDSSRKNQHTSFRINGAIYILNIKKFLLNPNFTPHDVVGYTMPRSRSIDIDTLFDFELASMIINAKEHALVA